MTTLIDSRRSINIIINTGLLCVLPMGALARTVEIDSISDFTEKSFVDNSTWVLVDLDNTLFQAKTAFCHVSWIGKEIQERMKAGASREVALIEISSLWIDAQKPCQVEAIETAFVDYIRSLQTDRNIVLGFTHRWPSIAPYTLRQISSVGIDFRGANLGIKNGTVLRNEKFTEPAFLKDGVVFIATLNENKAVVLAELFQKTSKPRKIILIDDDSKNIKALEAAAQDWGIEYLGVHYKAINGKSNYDPAIAAVQKRIFDETGIIISNDAAEARIIASPLGQEYMIP